MADKKKLETFVAFCYREWQMELCVLTQSKQICNRNVGVLWQFIICSSNSHRAS